MMTWHFFYLQVNPGSKAAAAELREGDVISSMNGHETYNLTNNEAQIVRSNVKANLCLKLNQ